MTERETGEPVTVLESGDPALIAVAKSLLDSAGIEYFAKGEVLQNLFGWGLNPLVGRLVELQVAWDDADDAKALLHDLGMDHEG
jgi:Putative prokaryotic signal transducing protein